MSQETLVVKIPRPEQEALLERLSRGSFEHRSVPHARVSVKGEGVVATLYNSGKFVVQGENPGLFIERFTGQTALAPPPKAEEDSAPISTRPTVGSDETGKGDFFGPLVVCAARLDPDQARLLREAGVMDSKKITDPRALKLGAWLRDEVQHSLQVLSPSEYNKDWAELGLHTLLSRQHARAIREVSQRGDRVVIDQFSKKDEIGPQLRDLSLEIEQRPRAESEVAVAAASILARAEFLVSLMELGRTFDLELRKGAGEPVDVAGVDFVKQHGMEALGQVAKLHFKNREKILARLDSRG